LEGSATEPAAPAVLLVGVVSDTHSRLDPMLSKVFAGVDHILHAGDVGDPVVLAALGSLAPVTAVRGNTDVTGWAWDLPDELLVEFGGARMLVAHEEPKLLRRHDPAREGLQAVITGHTHRPKMEWKDGVLYLNPGSAGPRRFGLARSVALLELLPGPVLRPRLVYLEE
jgi:putative phosphoesterase